MYKVGVDDMSMAVPSLYLSIEELAHQRGIDPGKLRFGLGLENMALCDVDEDVVTLGAKAVVDLIERNNLKPDSIGRIYVGTESSVDGSKPIATYILGLVAQYYQKKQIDSSALKNCDALDMTFACIGAFDAMHNSLAWLMTPAADDKVAIIVATDNALYDLASSGEYTQGAGAVASLLTRSPRIAEVDLNLGVGTMDEHDFFKPLRLQYSDEQPDTDHLKVVHSDTPVFDGPYSNKTYGLRITEAWEHFQTSHPGSDLNDYRRFVFHLPYAYHGRRVMPDLFFDEMEKKGLFEKYLIDNSIEKPNPTSPDYKAEFRAYKKSLTQTPFFKELVSSKIQPTEALSSQIGNVYTASIFMALMSALAVNNDDLSPGDGLLMIAYGSGSKSKICSVTLQPEWKSQVVNWNLNSALNQRTQISFDTYLSLRHHKRCQPIVTSKSIHQNSSGALETNKYARYYQMAE